MMISKNTIRTVFSLALAGASGFSFAQVLPDWQEWQQVSTQGKSAWMVEVENDSLLLKRDDRFFTAGDHLSRRFQLQTGTQVVEYGWHLGQDLYTGSDIKLTPAQMPVIDHPYAAWLYGGVWREQSDAAGRSWKVGVDIGCLGPCAAGEKSQEVLHKILRQPQPQGWSTQLKNEAGIVLSGSYSPGKMLPWTGVEFRPLIKGRIGNIFTDAGVEAELRAGNLNLLPGQQASYAFLRTELKWVGYNATVQGGYFRNQTLPVHIRHRGGEVELGYRWQGAQWGVNASVVRRMNEIREITDATGNQNFVRLQFVYQN